ncbi:MAG: adenosylcobalamin-dependent ribonucleoside-diphosphate reductase [Actinobacteria bacterium]|nr:adenosylcobalamin-dependent ribonucleoside-diphosphate reductase [Actinomycetota bacterium]MCL6105478.1 adenosylcobalamin-dependent ribonucleoside-diphosphate reductase [Actinomycetota bacterium]
MANGYVGIKRYFTKEGVHPYDEVRWEMRQALIANHVTGEVAFCQDGVEVPSFWSQNATNILASKYFRGTMATPEREYSLRQVVDRVVDTIASWGMKGGYFMDADACQVFSDELKYLIIHQYASFNSPVWFNIGVRGVPQQAAACFILSVDDTMDSILNWYKEEGIIFKGGSGAGVNLSAIRSSRELLTGGGTASGPVSFMRGADASAGTIKSGGKTRRAAKMVVLNIDHPDIEEFIWCKAKEEKKAQALVAAGFDMGVDGADSYSIQYQNANNSVRVTDEFMKAVIEDRSFATLAHYPIVGSDGVPSNGEASDGVPSDGVPSNGEASDGEASGRRVVKTYKAKELFRQVAEAAWECADPGLQYDTTINNWHTCPNAGRINASNPCSEYLHLDNSACNLASLNLLRFLPQDDVDDDGGVVGGDAVGDNPSTNAVFDARGFKQAVETVFTAQEILIDNADYPTEKITQNAKRFRELGLGYANLGALLMSLSLGYDSDDGRAYAAAITALMTGHAYATSARIAARMGPFAGFSDNVEPMLNVLKMHRQAVSKIEPATPQPWSYLLDEARQSFDVAIELAKKYGVRNSQATVLAPTGTISFLMDCDTTGVEPDLGLVKEKRLVGGGTMRIVNKSVERALSRLAYTKKQISDICTYINANSKIKGAPHISDEHRRVFACSMGEDAIDYMGHVKMMAAVQPFISGGISKTVNMPSTATVEDVYNLFISGWQMGLKAVAIYRDASKVGQPLSIAPRSPAISADRPVSDEADVDSLENAIKQDIVVVKQSLPIRERLPRTRLSKTFAFRIADCEGYVTVGEYPDGRPGEVFMKVSKQGSTLAGIMDAFSIAVSLGLQHGVPLATFVKKYTNMRFEPAGMSDDPDLRIATSLVDYIFRRLAVDYLEFDVRKDLGVLTTKERIQPSLPGIDEQTIDISGSVSSEPSATDTPSSRSPVSGVVSPGMSSSVPPSVEVMAMSAPLCYNCGNVMQPSGSCYVCTSCGSTSGCS